MSDDADPCVCRASLHPGQTYVQGQGLTACPHCGGTGERRVLPPPDEPARESSRDVLKRLLDGSVQIHPIDVAIEGRAPAVHGDALWGGPRLVENATETPEYVETKQQYWELLARTGLRMKDQQESQVPGASAALEQQALAELAPEPPPVVPPMTLAEARIYGAFTAILRRYGLLETVWCNDCFRRDMPSGVRMRLNPRDVLLECRCGAAHYRAPAGTDDVLLKALANTAIVELDKRAGTIMTPTGPQFRPTIILQEIEAAIIKHYVAALQRRNKEPRLFHKDCFRGVPQDEDNALAMSVTDDIILVCSCRTLFYRDRRQVETVH